MSIWQLFMIAGIIYIAPQLGEKTATAWACLCFLFALIAAIAGAKP